MGRLDGKIAIVTGSGRGIGRALALGLAREGAVIVVNDVPQRENYTQDLVEQIDAAGSRAVSACGDVSDISDAERLVQTALRTFGQIDILLNNAGIFPRSAVVEMNDAEWDRVIATNLKGTFLCSRAAARAMIPRRSGKIINTASGRALEGASRGAHYAASKAGIIAFSKSLALELAPHHINVNVLGPGITDTDQPRVGMTEQEIEEAGRQIPWGRIGRPEDLVGAAVFLSSDESEFVTGATIWVNGGAMMV